MQKFSFFENVWAVVRLIPEGKVTNYGSIAKYLGTGLSARMVGWAMNAAHHDISIPAHRVVNRNGLLSGKAHFATPTLMAERLQAEGIVVHNDAVVNYSAHFWDPSIEISLQ